MNKTKEINSETKQIVKRPPGNPNIAEARKLALLSPKNGVHGKHKKTIAKEKAREAYELKMLEEWNPIIKLQLKEALKKENRQEREYVINQTIGKPTDRTKVELDIDINVDL